MSRVTPFGDTDKAKLYTENNAKFVALTLTDKVGVEHVVIFNADGVIHENRKDGATTRIFTNH